MRAIGFFLGCALLVSNASGQPFEFQTVLHADGPVPTGAGGVVDGVSQIVLQDDSNAVATLGTTGFNFAIIFSTPSGGGYDSSLISQSTDTLYGGGGTFGDLQNIALTRNGASGSRITFSGQAISSDFGIFQHDVGEVTPENRVLFENDTFEGNPFTFNAGLVGGVAHQVRSDGTVLFAGTTSAADYVVSGNGGSVGAVVDDSQPATDVLSSFALPPAKWAYTASGGAVFIAQHEHSIGQFRTDVIAVNSTLGAPSVRFPGGELLAGKTYEPTFVYGATDNDALFVAQANDGEQALIVARDGDYKILGSYDPIDINAMRPDAIITEDRKVAAFIPSAGGGSVVYYDSENDGPITVVAAIGTDVNDDLNPLEIKDISIIDVFAPMVNDNSVIVFDAKIADESGPGSGDLTDALLAWWPELAHPIIVAKVGDEIEIGGSPQTISAILPTGLNPLSDGSIYKDGLNNSNYLAFGVGYEENSKLAVMLVQIPEPAAGLLLLGLAGIIHFRRWVG